MKNIVLKLIKEKNFLSLLANFSTSILTLLSFVVLIRSVGTNDFGRWVLFTAARSLVDLLRFGLTRPATVKFLSSATEQEKKNFMGSAAAIGFLMVLFSAVVLYPIYFVFQDNITTSGYDLFFIWYPIVALTNLSWNHAWSFHKAQLRFDSIFWIRFLNYFPFFVFLVYNYYYLHSSIETIVIVFILSNIVSSVYCFFKKWDGFIYLNRTTKEKLKQIWVYGVYSMATQAGSSLLRSADTFIISFSSYIGSAGVALYSIPLKYVEIIEIPLRSFISTAFPQMSKAHTENKPEELKKVLYTYAGAVTLLLVPVTLAVFIFAKSFVWILGGKEYYQYVDQLLPIMYLFMIYGLLLPLDRFTGVALDSLNKPNKNFNKMIWMLSINIAGDAFAVFGLHYFFPNWSLFVLLFFVALVSVVFTVIGLYVGYNYTKKEVNIKLIDFYKEGINFYLKAIKKMLKRK